jgi:hypothetical protein
MSTGRTLSSRLQELVQVRLQEQRLEFLLLGQVLQHVQQHQLGHLHLRLQPHPSLLGRSRDELLAPHLLPPLLPPLHRLPQENPLEADQ